MSAELLSHLAPEARKVLLQTFQFAITDTMRAAGKKPDDGVYRQFVPAVEELTIARSERHDPIGDDAHMPVPFLVHRYHNRVLLKVVPSCAVYCRFCFRKELIGRKGEVPSHDEIAAAHTYLRGHPEVQEVILSGGDPLTLSARRLQDYVAPLKSISSVKRIRVHTRIPVVAPAMVKAAWLHTLEATGKEIVFVLHINHPQEFTPPADALLKKLAERYLLLSQSVLLKGVNDDAQLLAELMEAFLTRRIKPYYLHHLDLARGTGHFRVSLQEGAAIYRELRSLVSGIALPQYIVEIPGGVGKVPVLELSATEKQQLNKLGIY